MMKQYAIPVFMLCFQFSVTAQTEDKIIHAYRSGELERTINLGKQYLDSDSLNSQVILLLGRAYADQGEFKQAMPFLRRGLQEKNAPWIKAWSLAYLGMSQYMSGQCDSAKNNLEECILLKATSNSTRYAEKRLIRYQMTDPFNEWEVIETEHFRFHFQDRKAFASSGFMSNRENAYLEINEFFHAKLPKKIDFFVWNDREEAMKLLSRPLGYTDPEICLINSANDQTSGHEITHVLSSFGLHPTVKSKLINEGVAVFFDQSHRDRTREARQALQRDSLNLIDLWMNPQSYKEEVLYSVGGAFVGFLAKRGEAELKALLGNQTIESARAIYPDFDQLVTDFQKLIVVN